MGKKKKQLEVSDGSIRWEDIEWRDVDMLHGLNAGQSFDFSWVDETHIFRDNLIADYTSQLDKYTYGWFSEALKNYENTGSRGSAVSEKEQPEGRGRGCKITVDLNRRLTPAEKFDLRRAMPNDEFEVQIHTYEYAPSSRGDRPIPGYDDRYTSITITGFEDNDDPVSLLREFAAMVEDTFLNVYPRSVHTHYPRVDGRD